MTINHKRMILGIFLAMVLSAGLCLFSVRAEQDTKSEGVQIQTETGSSGQETETMLPQAEEAVSADPITVSEEPGVTYSQSERTEPAAGEAADPVLNGLCYDPADGKTLRYYKNGVVDTSYTGFAVLQETSGGTESRWFYVESGTVPGNRNDIIHGLIDNADGWYLVRNSEFTRNTTVAQNQNGWWYVKDGKVDFGYWGLESNENGRWFLENGKVTFQYTGFAEDAEGWWYVSGSCIDYGKYDVINGNAALHPGEKVSAAWWCVKGGKVFGEETVAYNKNGWWYVKDGKVDFGYNGFASNENGWWYLENGKVTFQKNSIIYGYAHTDPKQEGEAAWWYVRNSCVTDAETIAQNENGWYYVNHGKVDFTRNSVDHNENGWWYVKDGKVDFGYKGFARNKNGWWYLENGKVTFQKNSIIYGSAHTDPTQEGETAWWYVRGSCVTKAEDVAQNENGWYYVKDGKVDFSFTGLKPNSNGYWYIRDGKVDFGWNSVEQNEYGWWCVHGGKVDFGFTGLEKRAEDGVWYYIKGGGVDFGFTGLVYRAGAWYYVAQGMVNWSYNGNAALPGSGRVVNVVNGVADFVPNVPSTNLLWSAGSILDSVGWNLWAAYCWCLMPWTYYDVNGDYGIGHYAYYGVTNHHGNCYVMAATFTLLARTLGYEAVQMSGYVPSIYGGQSPHSWVEVYYNGSWRAFDPDFQAEGHGNGFDFVYGTPGTWRYANYYPMHN